MHFPCCHAMKQFLQKIVSRINLLYWSNNVLLLFFSLNFFERREFNVWLQKTYFEGGKIYFLQIAPEVVWALWLPIFWVSKMLNWWYFCHLKSKICYCDNFSVIWLYDFDDIRIFYQKAHPTNISRAGLFRHRQCAPFMSYVTTVVLCIQSFVIHPILHLANHHPSTRLPLSFSFFWNIRLCFNRDQWVLLLHSLTTAGHKIIYRLHHGTFFICDVGM